MIRKRNCLPRPPRACHLIVSTPDALHQTIAALRGGTGPVAVDAERAHGFRYSQRAYLIQLRRAGSGTHLVDPIAFGQPADLSELGRAISDAEWVIHAASQDLPCLHEVGLVPTMLFDTELAARLLGYPRVALGTMVEELMGVRLLKEHSASDWSRRPLPEEWLIYAALDVELLIELRDRLSDQLVETGKWPWAEQEFAALVASAGVSPEPRRDPWRRTSGIHHVHSRRGLAYVAELWYARDAVAQRLDRAPSKILPDVAITELAAHKHPGSRHITGDSRVFTSPGQARRGQLAGGARRRGTDARQRPATDAHSQRRATTVSAVAGQESRGCCAAGGSAQCSPGHCRAIRAANGEPHHARSPTPAGLAPAFCFDRGGGRSGAGRSWCPALAARADRSNHHSPAGYTSR